METSKPKPSNVLAPTNFHCPKVPQSSKLTPPVGDQLLKYMIPWWVFLFKIPHSVPGPLGLTTNDTKCIWCNFQSPHSFQQSPDCSKVQSPQFLLRFKQPYSCDTCKIKQITYFQHAMAWSICFHSKGYTLGSREE